MSDLSPVRSRPRRPVAAEDGWVMVPVIALMIVALGLGFALLALVDRQTQASAQERDRDAVLTLAEGVGTAAANVLATDASAADWVAPGCRSATGDLRTPPVLVSTLAGRIAKEVQRAFRDDASVTTYARGGRTTTWSAQVCPTTDSGITATDSRFTPAVLSRPATMTTGTVDGHRTLWVRAQADVKDSTGALLRSRAIAVKVQQDDAPFTPPLAYAVGTGSFSTDLGNTASGLLKNVTNNPTLLNGVLGKVLGTNGKSLIEDKAAKIGMRCGVLNGLEPLKSGSGVVPTIDPKLLDLNLCLGGVLGGLDGITKATGLDTLTDGILGANRYVNLDGYTMAPAGAADAYRIEAQRNGTYRGVTAGVSTIAGTTAPADAPTCNVPWTSVTKDTVVFIEQVGTGEQYCVIPDGVKAKAVVVARGRVIVRGPFEGLVYMLNLNECDGAPTTGCTSTFRSQHRGATASEKAREVVRVEGAGSVKGAVWTDGAYSQVGLYPSTPAREAAVKTETDRVLGNLVGNLSRTADTTICNVGGSLPLVGPLVTAVGNLLTGLVSGVLGGVSEALFGKVETQVLPDGITPAAGSTPSANTQACGVLNAALDALSPIDLLNVTRNGGTVPVDGTVWIKKSGGVLNPNSYPWREATPAEIAQSGQSVPTSFTIPSTALSQLDGLLNVGSTIVDLQNALVNTFSNITAVTKDETIIKNATIGLPSGASKVPGSFRSVPVGL